MATFLVYSHGGVEHVTEKLKAQGVINIQKLSELAEADLDDIGISEPSDRRKLTYLLQKVRVAVRDVDAYVQENTPPKLKSVFDNISMEPSVLELSSPVASTSSEQTETELAQLSLQPPLQDQTTAEAACPEVREDLSGDPCVSSFGCHREGGGESGRGEGGGTKETAASR